MPTTESGKSSTSWLSKIIHEMERGVCYSRPGNKDCSGEVGDRCHFQIWSPRKDLFRLGTKLGSPAVPGNVWCSTWTRPELLHTTQKMMECLNEWTVPGCKTCWLNMCLIISATGMSTCHWWWWPIVPVHMHPRSALHFIFCLDMRYDCQLMLCLDHNQTTTGKCQTMWETCLTPLKKCISMPESTFQAAQKHQQDHHYQRIAGEQNWGWWSRLSIPSWPSSTHHGKVLTLWWLGLANWPIISRLSITPGRGNWYISTTWNSVVHLTHWISSTFLTRLPAQCWTLQCEDHTFHLQIFHCYNNYRRIFADIIVYIFAH